MGGTALGASGRSNNGLKLDVKTGKLSLWRLFPTFTFTFTCAWLLPPTLCLLVTSQAVSADQLGDVSSFVDGLGHALHYLRVRMFVTVLHHIWLTCRAAPCCRLRTPCVSSLVLQRVSAL